MTLDLSVQGNTEVNGGDGTDTINYAINAPVSIDGGAGFDKVVVLGTPFNDAFVVTSQGIFGANLNVTFVNVESAELDTLEGNDTIYILGTNPDIVTTVIGGLGSDTIQVLGDVTLPIVSNEQGRSGVITQGLSSNDPTFDDVGANGVAVNVLSAAGESLVKIEPIGAPLLVTEGGTDASYFISLVAPNAAALAVNPVYLTVSAGVVSGSDRKVAGAGLLVSTDGSTFTNAVVLTFNGATAGNKFKIWVKAIDDSAAEGPRVALISHSIVSNNPMYEGLPLIDVFVNVLDNDKPGLDIRHLIETAPNTYAPDTRTEVLEGASGFSDVYSVALTAQPAWGEEVTVNLQTDVQVSAVSKLTGLTHLTFTYANWNTPQVVLVNAVNDSALDGTELSTITHQITSSGGKYFAFPSTDYPKLTLTVYDDETPGLVVQETDGSTVVVENGASDSYRVRLTSAPSSDVTLTMRTDKQTFLRSPPPGFQVLDQRARKPYYEYSFTFTPANWHDWVVIDVSANPAFAGTDSVLKAFPPQDQNLEQIRGPLIIEGGLGSAGADRSLQRARAAAERDQLGQRPGTSNPASEPGGIDTLNVFHTDNTDADVGPAVLPHDRRRRSLDPQPRPRADRLRDGRRPRGEPGQRRVSGFPLLRRRHHLQRLRDRRGPARQGQRDADDRRHRRPRREGGRQPRPGDDYRDPWRRRERHDLRKQPRQRPAGDLRRYVAGRRPLQQRPARGVGQRHEVQQPGQRHDRCVAMPDKADGFVGVVIYGGAGNDTIYGGQTTIILRAAPGTTRSTAGAGNDHIYGDSVQREPAALRAGPDHAVQYGHADSARSTDVRVTTDAHNRRRTRSHRRSGDDIVFGDHGEIGQEPGTRRRSRPASRDARHRGAR